MKHRSSRPLAPFACASLSLTLGFFGLVAPTLVRAQADSSADTTTVSDAAPDASPTADASGIDSAGTVGATDTTETPMPEAMPEASENTESRTETTIATTKSATETTATTETTTMKERPMASTEAIESESNEAAPSNPEQVARATSFISQALSIAEKNPAALVSVVRGSASLIPRTGTTWRSALTTRWIRLVQAPNVPRGVRLDAYSAFFEAATKVNRSYARTIALQIPDTSARVGALLSLSQDNGANWTRSVNYVSMAQRAAEAETNPQQKARALTFIAVRLASLNPETRERAVYAAWTQTNRLAPSRSRDYLLAEIVGAAAQFDMKLAGRVAGTIGDANLKNLAQARINMAELSQTLLTASSTDRVTALAKSVVRYDVRAVPILIQLPPQADVLKALSDSLPPIYPAARANIDATLLERMWNYSIKAETSVPRDELQSRLARVMVTQDVWRGRTWGKLLGWKGGRIQVGAFIKAVLQSRRAQVKAMSLQDVAKRNVDAAIKQSQNLPPVARAEALLLIAGQLLETPTS